MKPQTPVTPPRYRFRPRSDHYELPAFREPTRLRLRRDPLETYDPANERRPFSWSELADPTLIVSAVCTVIGGGLVLAFWFVQ